jgi:hypothetical protein
MNIIITYFAAMSDKGMDKSRAIEAVNDACGKSYNHSRMSEFERGIHTPPAKVIRYMARASINWVINLSPDINSNKQIADALTPEPKKS